MEAATIVPDPPMTRGRRRDAAGIGGFGIRSAPLPVPPRVLILSWEYPPIVEGGLARHVRKLAEQLVAQDHEVHVLTRADVTSPKASARNERLAWQAKPLSAREDRHGVTVHRV